MATTETDVRRGDHAWAARHQAILDAAHALFVRCGYGGTTMKELAARAGCSVGYLYKHFPGKQEILDALSAAHMDVYDEIRARTRADRSLAPLDCLGRELELMCLHIADHRALIPIYAQRESEMAPALCQRVERMRQQDVALLDEARRRGELPDLDTAQLAAVYDGAVWGLLKSLALDADGDAFLRIPRLIDDFILEPLRRRARAQQEGPQQT